MLTTIEIGRRIANARKAKGFSQTQIANHLAISPQAVGKWERGESLPDVITLDRLGSFLGVGLEFFSESYSPEGLEPPDKVPVDSDEPDWAHKPDRVQQSEADTTKEMEWDFSHGDWQGSDFSGLKNLAKTFKGSNILRCTFADSDLQGLQMRGNTIVGSVFRGSNLSRAMFKGSNVDHNDFSNCLLTDTEFHASKVSECNFSGTDLSGAVFKACSIIRCKTEGARWYKTTFKNTQLKGIVISGEVELCYFDNCEFSETEFREAHLINSCFKGKGLKKLRFTNCTADNITYAFLKSGKANLSGLTIVEQT